LGAVTKQYADAIAAGINFHAAVTLSSTANIAGTYNNGTSGVGATLTVTATGLLSIDNTSVTAGARVLIKSQTTQTQNGVYTVTTAGTTGVSAVLTRATDQDNSTVGEMANGDIVYTNAGSTQIGKTFVNSSVGAITIGTTNITYSEYSASLPAQTGNSGKYLTTDGTTPTWQTINQFTAPTLGTTVITSGTTVSTIDSVTFTNSNITSPVTSLTTTAYTLVASDAGKIITATTTAAQIYSIPTSGTAIPTGSQITIVQAGAGQVTIQAVSSGVTTVTSNGVTSAAPKIRSQWSAATLLKTAAETWVVIGDIS
jgi:hypothetical protein